MDNEKTCKGVIECTALVLAESCSELGGRLTLFGVLDELRLGASGEGFSFVVYEAADLFLITERGFGKRTALSQFRSQGRGGQGVIAMKTDGDRGRLAGVKVVRPDLHELVIVSNFGTTIRIDAESVSHQGRSAQGVRVMNLRAGDSVSAIAKVVSSRGAVEDSGGDELSLEELVNEPDAPIGVTPNGEVVRG